MSEQKNHKVTMLGSGLIGMFYTMTMHNQRGADRVHSVYSRREERATTFAEEWNIPHATTNLEEAINHPDTDVVVIGLPNNLHLKAVELAAKAGKAILCTKPLGRTAEEAKAMLDIVETEGVFGGYLEDLVYPPKTLKALESVHNGALGKILWVRSRETHPGPHSDWFWDLEQAGGGAIVDMGCHCIEIIRNFVGKDNKPLEVMCWADTLVHPIDAEDHGIALIRFESGAMGQFEVGWAFRGGMDLRDEVSGSEGTIWLNHWLRTGFEMFSAVGQGGYVAEKAESDTGWLFPVGDEVAELGYRDMFLDMFNAIDEEREPLETFYDGYVVNAIIDACYRSAKSKKWENVEIEDWRGSSETEVVHASRTDADERLAHLKDERMPDGRMKRIYRDRQTGEIIEKVEE